MGKKFVGIDPGLSGGICVMDEEENVSFYDIPRDGNRVVDVESLFDLFANLANSCEKTFIAIEKQQPFPGQGVVSNSRIVAEFAYIHATARIIAKSHKVNVLAISARAWQRLIYGEDDKKGLGKDRSIMAYKRIISQNLPLTGKRKKRPHLGYIDAALISLYIKRISET